MDFEDPTVRQHFVSQVEQRLNAINPSAEDRNQRIYRFRLIDREAGTLSLPSKAKISGNLMLHDLFSFDRVPGSYLRGNLEKLFQEYEGTIELNTRSILHKISNGNDSVESEAKELLRSKLLNFFRNPFSVKKVLNSLPDRMENLHPTDPDHYRDYLRVLSGDKPQRQHICQALDITEQEYEEWLRSLFFMLNPMIAGQPSFYDQMVSGLRGNRETFLMVGVFTYSAEACLLSDRGFVIPFEDDEHDGWSFNLAANAFVIYSFTDIDLFYKNYSGSKPPIPVRGMEHVKDMLNDGTYVVHRCDDLDALRAYNRNAVYQCHEHVYGSRKEYHGVP